MAIDKDTLSRAEVALGIKLYDWQRAYLTNEPIKISISIMGRVQGHTTAYILKLLLEDTEVAPLDLRNKRAKQRSWTGGALAHTITDVTI